MDFFHHGDYAKAIASFDKTIAINQNNAEVWCGGGLAQGALRRWTDAVSSFDEAIALKDDDSNIWFSHGYVLEKL